ncbi:MAG TPA: ribosome maturation factor RimP [bacterium]|jgi:ribosome maturation factor RimP|nr:ribosome maturation factor RimP [bacterium]
MSSMNEPKNDQLRQLAEAVAKDNFVELFDLVIRPQGKKLVVTVAIDKKLGKITVEECAKVSLELEKRLDELDVISPSYLLEVSSPGLDRALRHLEDCRRFQGRLAQFVFSEPVEAMTTFRGRLGEVKEESVEVVDGKRTIWVPFKAVKRANLVVEI